MWNLASVIAMAGRPDDFLISAFFGFNVGMINLLALLDSAARPSIECDPPAILIRG
jgi:hypothetical protein